MATKLSSTEYNLLLQNDVNSNGHTQWFFFKVDNTTKHLAVKFNILNLVKGASLYNEGMQISIYSTNAFLDSGKGWFKGGRDIAYFSNGHRRENVPTKTYFTLTFTYEFPSDNDTVYFAYSVPYTYSMLKEFLNSLESDPSRSQYITRKNLCRTLAGNKCEYLTITNPSSSADAKLKRGVILSARVHPGETVGSWMIQGLLNFLTSAAPEAHNLRDQFLFKIVPMLNPDGVVNGNNRTNITGADLNRRWKTPSKVLHPTIYSMKKMIRNLAQKVDIEIICDFHGHSRKKNVFIYGCNKKSEPQACKLFPYILSKVSPHFCFTSCRFNMQKSKEATLRISLFKELRIPKVYTLEASFAGPDYGQNAHTHFTTSQLEDIGKDFLIALLVLCPPKMHREPKLNGSLKSRRAKMLRKSIDTTSMIGPPSVFGFDAEALCAEFLQNDELLRAGEEADSSDDSDSEPSEDNLDTSKLSNLMPKERKAKAQSLPRPKLSKITNKKPVIKIELRTPTKFMKKCPECGEALTIKHVCNPPQPPPPPPAASHAPSPPSGSLSGGLVFARKSIGLRTYYNKFGKKVSDQASQTPAAFYTKNYSLRNRRTSSISRPETSEEDPSKLLSFRVH
mmetsp:Transcript_19970/g.36999  ORF Transcript_19970/g.36999 Transcript_19970/m.36999 type:complete len:620 (+) Transcript_19970:488-2347(+)